MRHMPPRSPTPHAGPGRMSCCPGVSHSTRVPLSPKPQPPHLHTHAHSTHSHTREHTLDPSSPNPHTCTHLHARAHTRVPHTFHTCACTRTHVRAPHAARARSYQHVRPLAASPARPCTCSFPGTCWPAYGTAPLDVLALHQVVE
eukprot:349875-Chlamydomonas_euryale.AAC.3